MTLSKSIYFTVTNDLNQDQRMHRICRSFTKMGYNVCLVGRIKPQSLALPDKPYQQLRIKCTFNKGFLFYAEYNIRLLIFLLFRVNPDIIYSVDADTLAACALAKKIKRKKMIFDSHEYFSEVPEVINRPFVKRIWQIIEKIFIPWADKCITVNQSLADLFTKNYNKPFSPIYNVPPKSDIQTTTNPTNKPYVLYQGMLNRGRGLEVMIEAMPLISHVDLQIIGEGDISEKLKKQANESPAKNRIIFTGWLPPAEIKSITAGATLGINLLDAESKSYYFSLANKFFDYVHACVPSVNMNFPEYRDIINQFEVGILISKLNKIEIANSINALLKDQPKYVTMKSACRAANEVYNWENEEIKLKKLMKKLSAN